MSTRDTSREARTVRVTSIEVARANARHALNLAERCTDMVVHWARRADARRAEAVRWTEIAEQGARMLAKDIADAEDAVAHPAAVVVPIQSQGVAPDEHGELRRSA